MSCVTINLTRQARLENDETFNVSIASSDSAVRLTNDVTVVTIQGGGSKSLVHSVYHMTSANWIGS